MTYFPSHLMPLLLIPCFFFSLSDATISAQTRPDERQRLRREVDPIEAKFAELKSQGEPLGRPAGDVESTRDGGRFRRFEYGFIFWSEATGAHAVWGLIGAKWSELGLEKSALGYPVTDELTGPTNRNGRFNDFQHGMIRYTPDQGITVLLDQTIIARSERTAQRMREQPRAERQEQTSTSEVVVNRTMLEDGSVQVETHYPNGTVVRATEGGITTIYPDGHSEIRLTGQTTVSAQPPSPPLSPSDSAELNRWREYHAGILLDIIKSITKNDVAVNGFLNRERSYNFTTYGQINFRTMAIRGLMGK